MLVHRVRSSEFEVRTRFENSPINNAAAYIEDLRAEYAADLEDATVDFVEWEDDMVERARVVRSWLIIGGMFLVGVVLPIASLFV